MNFLQFRQQLARNIIDNHGVEFLTDNQGQIIVYTNMAQLVDDPTEFVEFDPNAPDGRYIID